LISSDYGILIHKFFVDDFLTDIDALIADVSSARTRNQLSHLILGFAAERTSDFLIRHIIPLSLNLPRIFMHKGALR
jgi:hypothetical protein